MRVLFTTRGSAGHLLPLVPVAEACPRAGHEVLVAAQDGRRGDVDRAGLACAPVADPDPARWGPLMARLPDLSIDEADEVLLRDFFADMDTAAALPDLDRVAGEWRPDVLVRESWELAATLVLVPLFSTDQWANAACPASRASAKRPGRRRTRWRRWRRWAGPWS